MASAWPECSGERREYTYEPPAKKRRTADRPGTGLLGDPTMIIYETLEEEARGLLKNLYEKLCKFLPEGNMWDGLKYLKDRLTTLKESSSLDPICIGLLGNTGTGKSSLLNAIIERQFFLPTSGYQACTSCMVQVSSGRGQNYEAKIHLLSEEEWREELKNLVEVVGNPDEKDSDVDEAGQKLRALYGKNAETRPYEELLRAKPLIPIPPSRCVVLKDEQAEKLCAKLDPYVRSQRDEEEPGPDAEKALERLWPLVKYVEVKIPKSDVIPEGVVFVDIPGTGDYNSKRDDMWKESIKKCSVIWVISDIKRILGEKGHEQLLAEGIKAYQGGMCRDLALVVTQSDNLNLGEYKRERKVKNKSIRNKHDAIIERNTTVKLEKGSQMKVKLQKNLESDLELLKNPDLVYTVSAEEYWEGKYLTKEETEIPKLRARVRTVYHKEKKKQLEGYMSEVHSAVLLAQNNFTKEAMDLYQQRELESFMEGKIEDLEKETEKCFAQLEQLLHRGLEEAKFCHAEVLPQLISRNTNRNSNQGFHRTLKALCQKNGVYMSPTFGYLDLNTALAQPIYDAINPVFAEIFRRDDPCLAQAAGTPSSQRASLRPCLDKFRTSVQAKIRDVRQTRAVTSDTWKIKFLIQETNIILSLLERKILQRKIDIYSSLVQSIQSHLRPHYEVAAQLKGPGSFQRMKKILQENIERETKDRMFDNEIEKMNKQLQDLKDKIKMQLQKAISMMFKVAPFHWEELTKELPDFNVEYRKINRLLELLKKM
ncbi:nuclear GTPase SLIP-GC-like [Pelodiscus sinensis]|uniref:nuclear GTPase SLIP-GC-like n=1 Tax=Pelodiscus sinensis TaxID=13735 RepID=UPI003F6A7FCE